MPPTANTCNWWRKLKLLLDQNLSPSLVARLRDIFPGSTHVQDVHLERAPDSLFWEYARENGFAIVTQDADFADRVLLEGFPPKVLWLRAGNRTTGDIESLFRDHADRISEFSQNPDAGVLVIR